MKYWLKEYKQFIIAAIFFSILGTGVTFALPYVPTDQELDPTCAPGDTDCYVSILPDQTSNTGKLLFTDGTNPAWASNLYWDETNDRLGVGTSAPTVELEVVGDIVSKGTKWVLRSSTEDRNWRFATYGNGLFVATARTGAASGAIMTSPDGVNWTARNANSSQKTGVCYGSGLFVVLSDAGNASTAVETSVDGITWTARTAPNGNAWRSCTYGNGLFVAVSENGTGNRVMTSSDGITWTSRTSASDNNWTTVTYGNGLFVAVAATGTGDRIMTSPDGITWTSRTNPVDNDWYGLTYGNGLFVATAATGTDNRVMTSPDGITWTSRTSAADNQWISVTYGNGLFVAVSNTGTGDRIMTSPDGINWTLRASPVDKNWRAVVYGNGTFVATSDRDNGDGDTVMTSGKQDYISSSPNNIYQGGLFSMGNVGIKTSSPIATLDINGDTIISGTSRYLNFDTTSGTSGYGFRDNAGVMEYKNSGGSWTGFSSGSSPFSIVNTSSIFSTGLSGTGSGVTTVSYATFIGVNAGSGATAATNSNFFGQNAGLNASAASTSNFIGVNAGSGATSANNSNFFGQDAGENATGANNSNFFGRLSGDTASSATYSNFFGFQAGSTATNATQSNFFGRNAGSGATNASSSNFIGRSAGNGATGASNANFIGYQAGYQASSAIYSNILGYDAGYQASNASYSNLFGYRAGLSFTANNIGSNNIIIGTNVSLPDTTANAVNIGGILFGTGTYATTTGNPSITPVSGGKIGIGVVAPSYTLQVGNSSIAGIVARFENSTGTCDINPTNTALICSSDLTLKKNINSIDSSLSLLTQLRPVTYNWNTQSDDTTPTPGFIAQEVETIFPFLVTTDTTTNLKSLNYTLFTPYIIKSIQELNTNLTSLDPTKPNTLASLIKEYLGDALNGLERLFVKNISTDNIETETLCFKNGVCVTGDQVQQLLQNSNTSGSTESSNDSENTNQDSEITETPAEENTIDEETPVETVPEDDPIEIIPEEEVIEEVENTPAE